MTVSDVFFAAGVWCGICVSAVVVVVVVQEVVNFIAKRSFTEQREEWARTMEARQVEDRQVAMLDSWYEAPASDRWIA